MQIKTTMSMSLECYHQKIQKIASTGKDMEELELLCTVGRNVKWYGHFGKQYGGSLKH